MEVDRAIAPEAALTVGWLLAAVLSVGLLGCSGKDAGKGGGGGPPAVVTTTVLSPAPWADSIEALGTASARESVNIRQLHLSRIGKQHQ